jgi:hypothetical protein
MTDPSLNRVCTGRTLRTVAIVTAALISLAAGQGSKQQHFSTLEGNTIRMRPSGTSFQIPQDWTRKYNAVNITRTQLEKVRGGKGEWYREYARVANGALPFSDCSVTAGEDAWDSSGIGLQMRGYVVRSTLDDIEQKIAIKGLSAAKGLPRTTARNASVGKSESGQWHRILITYDVWYGDYGGRANVDFYSTEVEGNRIVLVFMYAGMPENANTVPQVLESFSKR